MGWIKNFDFGLMCILYLLYFWNYCMGDYLIVFIVWLISV